MRSGGISTEAGTAEWATWDKGSLVLNLPNLNFFKFFCLKARDNQESAPPV